MPVWINVYFGGVAIASLVLVSLLFWLLANVTVNLFRAVSGIRPKLAHPMQGNDGIHDETDLTCSTDAKLRLVNMAERQIGPNPPLGLSSPGNGCSHLIEKNRALDVIVIIVLGLVMFLTTVLILPFALIVALYVNANDIISSICRSAHC